MKGNIRLARMVSPPSSENDYRCEILALDTNAHYFAICNPSPYGWATPETNALVYFLDAPFSKRVIGCLHDLDLTREIVKMGELGEEAVDDEGNKLAIQPGDVYIGKYGRAFFSKSGDVDISTWNVRSELFLDQESGRSELSGYDFSLFTKDEGIYVYSEDSTGDGYGDTLHIEKNINDGADKITDLVINSSGDCDLCVGYTGATASVAMHLGATGDYSLHNNHGGISLVGAGVWEMFSGGSSFADALVGLKLDNGNNKIDIKAGTLGVDIDTMGITGDAASITISGTLTLKAGTMTIDSSNILLGKTAVNHAVLAELFAPLFNAHTHIGASPGSPTSTPLLPLVVDQIGSVATKVT